MYWLSRELGKLYDDPVEIKQKEQEVMDALRQPDAKACEDKLMEVFNFNFYDTITMLTKNKTAIYFMTRLHHADNDTERQTVQEEMAKNEKELAKHRAKSTLEKAAAITKKYREGATADEVAGIVKENATEEEVARTTKQIVDLDQLAFSQGAQLNAKQAVKLPQGTKKLSRTGYEEIYVPAMRPKGAQ